MSETRTLYYVHDPMCSWCWAFVPTWEQIQRELPNDIEVVYLLGGLAPDSDLPMPEQMKLTIAGYWQTIQDRVPGTEFNYDFWTDCQPRRSTYPACRAIIACRMQQPLLETRMLLAIQQAYYLNAKNPSDNNILVKIADGIGLDIDVFSEDLTGDKCNKIFEKELLLTKKLAVNSFPGLVLLNKSVLVNIHIDYTSQSYILKQIYKNIGSSF